MTLSLSPLQRIRAVLALFMTGLILSGVTAFPLLAELRILCTMLGVGDAASPKGYAGLQWWILFVREGLEKTYAAYPFIGYGTDWLAFGHIVIALFFVGPWKDPVHNRWVLHIGLIACAGVIPLALICGPIRGIPLYWRLVDCSFGLLGCLPLLYALRLTWKLEERRGITGEPA
jgi:hypothetical protein